MSVLWRTAALRCRDSRGRLSSTLLVLVALACQRESVPTFTAEPAQFARRVTADGVLKAVKATPLAAPMNVPQSLRIASIADDGALVKKDDLVVTFDPTVFATPQTIALDHTRSSSATAKSKPPATSKTSCHRRSASKNEQEGGRTGRIFVLDLTPNPSSRSSAFL